MTVKALLLIAVLLALILVAPSKLGISVPFIGNPQKGEMISVVVAKMNIPRGMLVSADLIKTRDYPKDLVPAGAISKPEEAIGRTVAIPLTKDAPVLHDKLTPMGSGP
jgi:Flp pilus assembly protein CpaB